MKIIDKLENKTEDAKDKGLKFHVPLMNRRGKSESFQLGLGLKESPINRIFEVRQKLEKVEDRLRASNFYKNIFVWIILIFPLIMGILSYGRMYEMRNLIPINVPLLRLFTDLSEIFLPNYFLYVLPALPLVVSWLSIILIRISYRKLEKYLFSFLMFSLTLSAMGYYIVVNILNIYSR